MQTGAEDQQLLAEPQPQPLAEAEQQLLAKLQKEAASGKPKAKAELSSRGENGRLVCYRCKAAPATLVRVEEAEYMILGADGSLDLYRCQGSCTEQAQAGFRSLMKQADRDKKQKQQKATREAEHNRAKAARLRHQYGS